MSAPQRRKRKFSLRTAGIAALLLIAGGAVGAGSAVLTDNNTPLPRTVSDNTPFDPHLPQDLPGSYQIDNTSFNLDKKEGVLAYRATDRTGDTINFTEQERPKGLDFADLYQQQLSDVKTITGTVHNTVAGMNETSGLLTISVLTDTTWILITTRTPLSDADIRLLANGISD